MKRFIPLFLALVLAFSLAGCGFYTDDDLASIRTKSFDSGYQKGLAEGRKIGYDAGEKAGYKNGLADATSDEALTKAWLDGFGSAFYGPGGQGEGLENDYYDTGTTSSSNQDEVTVYVTDTGTKYHNLGCQYLSESQNAITLSAAKAQGYGPCSRCNPPT